MAHISIDVAASRKSLDARDLDVEGVDPILAELADLKSQAAELTKAVAELRARK